MNKSIKFLSIAALLAAGVMTTVSDADASRKKGASNSSSSGTHYSGASHGSSGGSGHAINKKKKRKKGSTSSTTTGGTGTLGHHGNSPHGTTTKAHGHHVGAASSATVAGHIATINHNLSEENANYKITATSASGAAGELCEQFPGIRWQGTCSSKKFLKEVAAQTNPGGALTDTSTFFCRPPVTACK